MDGGASNCFKIIMRMSMESGVVTNRHVVKKIREDMDLEEKLKKDRKIKIKKKGHDEFSEIVVNYFKMHQMESYTKKMFVKNKCYDIF